MFPVSEDNFICVKKTVFRATAAIKQQRRLTIPANLIMVCSYHYYCLGLTVALVDFQVEGCASRLYHVYQGGYVDMHEIEPDEAERNICRGFFDELRM